MQEATFMVLTALAAGTRPGYGIIKDVESMSSGRRRLQAGTLYTALDRLRIDGLVAIDREEIVDGRMRRYYGLTPDGCRQLAEHAARLQADAAVALSRLPVPDCPMTHSVRVLLPRSHAQLAARHHLCGPVETRSVASTLAGVASTGP
jgi:DNA-binding PadR family transcriptional regulator